MKFFWIILLVVIGWGIWRFLPQEEAVVLLPSPTPSVRSGSLGLVENEAGLITIAVNEANYRMSWEVIPATAVVRVGINTALESGSQQLFDREVCRIMTSAAFYDANDKPLGLLVDRGVTLSVWRGNQLLNGAVGLDTSDATVKIVRSAEDVVWEWAVQAGPIVWEDGSPAPLRLTADQAARRIVAGVTSDRQLVLLVIVADDSLFLGPSLADVPALLAAWQIETGLKLTDAINLDGGTASTFLSPTLKLRELKPIGSYICIR
jgi:exopolysaccharide biosynthesis protein